METQEMPKGLKTFLKDNKVGQSETPVAETSAVEETPVVEATPAAETPAAPPTEPTPPVAETPAVEEKETAPATEPEPSWLDLDAAPSAEAPATENGVAQPSEKEKAQILDGLIADPEIQFILEAKKAGKSLADIAKEYQTVDYTSLEPEDVAKHYGMFKGWNDEQIEELISDFDSMGFAQKQDTLETWVTRLEANQSSKLQKLTGDYKTQSAQSQETEKRILDKFNSDVEREAALIVDKPLFGAKLTKEDADDFRKWVNTFDYVNPDGTYNVAMLRNFWIGAVKIPAVQKANYAQGKSDATKEVLSEIHRPSESSASASRPPAAPVAKSEPEKAQDAMKALFSGRKN